MTSAARRGRRAAETPRLLLLVVALFAVLAGDARAADGGAAAAPTTTTTPPQPSPPPLAAANTSSNAPSPALLTAAPTPTPQPASPLPAPPAAVAAPSSVHGAYLGCFRLAALPHLGPAVALGLAVASLDRCTPACRQRNHTFSAIEGATGACHCASAIPPDSARAPEGDCAAKRRGAAALFYHHHAGKGCRLANVPVRRESFDVHYGEHNLAWSSSSSANGGVPTLTVRMEGTSGARLATAGGKHLHGAFQVEALVSDASGAVTAFYTRSSDDYNLANHGVFSEIDYEFLNGHPGTRSSLWLNSYAKGVSGGERSVPSAHYAPLLGLPPGKTASDTWLTYTFSWQPDRVTWSANGVPLEKKEYGQDVSWVDMKGITHHRLYKPPDEPSHVSISMWADGDRSRAFGGPLDWGRSPFSSSFRELRRVLCDVVESGGGGLRAPGWVFGGEHLEAAADDDGAGLLPLSGAAAAQRPEFAAAGAAAASPAVRDVGTQVKLA